MANTVDYTKMGEFITRESDRLVVESATQAKSLDYVNVLLGIKHKQAIPYLNSTVELAAASCGWDPAGSDYFGERMIEVHPIEIEKEYCFYSFKPYVSNLQMRFAAGLESMPWEEKVADANVQATKAELEKALWQGNSGASITGWLNDAAADSAATVTFNSGQTVVDKVDAMVAALPSKMLAKNVTIFMSESQMRDYILQSNATCCQTRPIQDAANKDFTYVGDSRIKLVGVAGLEDAQGDPMVATTIDGLTYGTDIEDSEARYEWFEDKKESKFLLRIMFVAGTAILLPSDVLVGKAE